MATITIPGMGQVDQKWAFGGLAAAAGVLGYAWYKRGSGGSGGDVEIIPNPETIPDTDRTPVVGDSTGSFDETDDDVIGTNSQWTQKAVEFLSTTGSWDSGMITTALGKYLGGRPLTQAEIDIVLAARGAFGDPPVGGPYSIKEALPAQVPAAVTDLQVVELQSRSAVIRWTAAPGATSYHLRLQEPDGSFNPMVPDQMSTSTQFTWHPIGPGRRYTFWVAAKNSAGEGPWRTVQGITRTD